MRLNRSNPCSREEPASGVLETRQYPPTVLLKSGAQPGKCFGFAMLVLQASHQFLSFRVVAEKQGSRFRKGPLEMRVADLFAGEAIVFPGRLAGTFHQAAIGDKLLHTLEAGDVVNLVQNCQGEDLADSGDRAQQVEGVLILLFGLTGDEELELVEQGVIEVNQR